MPDRPIVCIHGFSHDASTFDSFGDLVAPRPVLAVDLAGHAGQPAPGGGLCDEAERIATIIATDGPVEDGRVHLLGYSMGARIALHVALARPDLVASLTVVSGTPGLRGERDRHDRRIADEGLARMLVERGIDAFMSHWEALPMFDTLSALAPDGRRRLNAVRRGHDPEALAEALRCFGTGVQADLWPELARLEAPVLIVTGALDTKFTEIGRQMQAVLPDAAHEVFAGVGHTAHLEAPQRFVDRVTDFVDGVDEIE